MECRGRQRAERQLLLFARGWAAHDRARQGGRDRVGPRQLRLDRKPGHHPLRRGEGGRDVHDADPCRGVGGAQHPRECGGAGPHRDERRRASALGLAGGSRTDRPDGPAPPVGSARRGGRRRGLPRLSARLFHHRRSPDDRRRRTPRARHLRLRLRAAKSCQLAAFSSQTSPAPCGAGAGQPSRPTPLRPRAKQEAGSDRGADS